MTTEPSERFTWLVKVRLHQERQARVRALREQLAAARDAGKRIRHAQRLRRTRGGDTEGRTHQHEHHY